MPGENTYKNGQIISKIENQQMTYFFRNGNVKAIGNYFDKLMEGEWKFFRENGQLWQIGQFKASQKDGYWIRYDRNGNIEYKELFENGKKIKELK